jgi:transposase
MESTGVYWMPVRNVLERGEWKFDLVLVNPQHVRALQGEKTDDKDCRRLAELGQHDLLRGSFLPPVEIRELRDLTRRRSHMQGDRNRVINRIERLLETANFKLGSVASDIVGKTGWLILNAIARGETDPEQLAARAQGSLQLKKAELAEALRGYSSDHFRWLLKQLIEELSRLDTKLNEIDSRLRKQMHPYQDRHRHEPVRHGGARGELGGVVSRQLRERGQAAVGAHTERRPLPAAHADSERLGCCP